MRTNTANMARFGNALLLAASLGMMAPFARSATLNYWRFEEKPVFGGVTAPADGEVINSSNGGARARCEIAGDGAALSSDLAQWSVQIPTAQVPNPDPLDLTKPGTTGETINAGGVNARSTRLVTGNHPLEWRTSALEPAGEFTVEAYIRRDNATFASLGLATITSQYTINARDANAGWGLYLQGGSDAGVGASDGSLVLGMQNTSLGGWVYAIVDDPGLLLTDDAWHYVAATRDASNTIRLYVDGVEDTTLAGVTTYAGTLQPAATSWFAVGGTQNDARFTYDGYIDELRLSDLALSGDLLVPPVPEPATGLLVLLGATLLRRRRR